MQNMTELRKALVVAFNGIQDGSMPLKKAKEIANTAGKIIGTVKCQLVYAALRGETPEIEFMNTAAINTTEHLVQGQFGTLSSTIK